MGDDRRHETPPNFPMLMLMLMLAKSLGDATGGLNPFLELVTKHKPICSWCTVSTVLLVATASTTLPEARAAWRSR